MRRKEKTMTTEAIEAFIKNENILRLALSVDNMPYIVPLNYGYKDKTFYIHCALEGKKLDMLEKNKKVCVEIDGSHQLVTGDEACKYTMKFTSVIGFGTAEILSSPIDVKEGLDILMAQFSDMPFTYNEKAMAKVKVIKVTIDEMTGKSSQ